MGNKGVKLEVLMSVMHQENFDIAYQSKVDSDLLIINQCDKEGYQEIEVNGYTWRMISTTERGCAKSRNMALKNARGEICLLSDDDEVFSAGYRKEIIDIYQKNPNVFAIAFEINRTGNVPRHYSIKKWKRSSKFRGFGGPSISFIKEKVLSNNIEFNTLFGGGSLWGAGEDSLFIKALRDNKIKVYECPYCVATVNFDKSTWFDGFNEKYYYNDGAYWCFYYKKNIFLRELRFIYKAFFSCNKQLTKMQKLKWMHKGVRGFKKGIPYKDLIK